MTHKEDSKSGIKSITVRLPQKDYMLIRECADDRNVSLNSIISEAVAEYVARIGRQQALDRIHSLQERLRRNREPGSDSVELLREMREERSGPRGGGRP